MFESALLLLLNKPAAPAIADIPAADTTASFVLCVRFFLPPADIVPSVFIDMHCSRIFSRATAARTAISTASAAVPPAVFTGPKPVVPFVPPKYGRVCLHLVIAPSEMLALMHTIACGLQIGFRLGIFCVCVCVCVCVCARCCCCCCCPRLLKSVSHDSKAAKKALMVADASPAPSGSLEGLLQTVPVALRQIEAEMCDSPDGGQKGQKPSLWASLLSFVFGSHDVAALSSALSQGRVAAMHRKLALDVVKMLIDSVSQPDVLQELLWFLSSHLLSGADASCPLWSGIDGCGEEALKQVRASLLSRASHTFTN